MIRATAQAKPGKFLCADGAGYGLGAIVRPGTAALADTNHAPGKIALVEQDEKILGPEFVAFEQIPHRDATEIHERLRLGENNFLSRQLTFAHQSLAFGALDADGSAIGDFIHGKKTEVMRRPQMFRARIAKANDEPHNGKIEELLLLFLFLAALVSASFGALFA